MEEPAFVSASSKKRFLQLVLYSVLSSGFLTAYFLIVSFAYERVFSLSNDAPIIFATLSYSLLVFGGAKFLNKRECQRRRLAASKSNSLEGEGFDAGGTLWNEVERVHDGEQERQTT